LTRRTESISHDPDPSQRLEVRGRDELARLALSFNTTLDALERSVEAQRNLVADASHELRTPIATLRANIQLLRDADRLSAAEQQDLRADIITELDELTALVADVVELARGTKRTGELDDVRLDAIVGDVVARTRRRATDLDFAVELEPTLIEGEPERVGRAVTNLLDNARKWSPPGGTVEVTLADAVLSVRDHGPGFADDDLPHVFDRFYRAERARGQPGSGLGLAIVRQAAEAHGGWARASNAADGGALLQVSFGRSTSELTTDEVGASTS
jgi:two-component system sensor histidine kinase MprB